MKMQAGDICDKHGNPIRKGDYVFTRIRGGSHEGEVCWSLSEVQAVEEIIAGEDQAAEKSVKHPPKVRLTSVGLNIYES
ncbi:hypothetical protein N7492_002048, partial [Penicillium capsulatum]